MAWISAKHNYRDTEGQTLSIESNEDGAIILESKDGVYFEKEEDFLVFLEKLEEKAKSLFEEEV